eukprot:365311-Chlamydomonas_euryale.AAC.7
MDSCWSQFGSLGEQEPDSGRGGGQTSEHHFLFTGWEGQGSAGRQGEQEPDSGREERASRLTTPKGGGQE